MLRGAVPKNWFHLEGRLKNGLRIGAFRPAEFYHLEASPSLVKIERY
jgi:hypothetical protein